VLALSTRSACPNSLPTAVTEPDVVAMFNGEQRGLAGDERRISLAPLLIWLATAYAGLSTAVAGFVLDNTALVVVGGILVCSGSVLANLITKASNRSESVRLDVYEKGEQCESLRLSPGPLTP